MGNVFTPSSPATTEAFHSLDDSFVSQRNFSTSSSQTLKKVPNPIPSGEYAYTLVMIGTHYFSFQNNLNSFFND